MRRCRTQQLTEFSEKTILLGNYFECACLNPVGVLYGHCLTPTSVPICRSLLKDPKVRFAGYKHPHPLENDILVKIQTAPGYQPTAALSDSAKRLEDTFTLLQNEYRGHVARIRQEEAEIGGANTGDMAMG